MLLTELSKLWCSPELSAEDAQARATSVRTKLGTMGLEGWAMLGLGACPVLQWHDGLHLFKHTGIIPHW